MEDIKTYIQGHLKTIKGLDMSGLIETCGISRAKFYKCLKEPWRFDDIDLERIARKMGLNDSDRAHLFSFKHSAASKDPSMDTALTDASDANNLNSFVEKIFFAKQEILTDNKQKIFKFLREKSSNQTDAVLSCDELASEICNSLSIDANTKQNPLLEIAIFNAYTNNQIRVVFSLLQSLKRRDIFQKSGSISTVHFIGNQSNTLEKRLALYSDWHQLMEYCQYQMQSTDPLERSMFSSWDGCILKYAAGDNSNHYLVIHMPSDQDAVVFSSSDDNLFQFLRHNCSDLFREGTSSKLLSTNAVELTAELLTCKQNFPAISLTHGPCLDHLLPALYEESIDLLRCEDRYQKLLDASAAHNVHDELGKEQTIHYLINVFKHRFTVSKETGVISIFSARELRSFALNRQNIDMALIGLRFSKEQTIRQLRYFKESLDCAGQNGCHHFYLLNSSIAPIDKAVTIYRNHAVAMNYDITPKKPEVYFHSVTDAETSVVFYNYVVDHLLSEESRKMPNSPIMSNSTAEAFLDSLIEEVARSEN